MDTKLLSIIVPVYNVEDYLIKCVDSLVAGCKDNLGDVEILLIDDGSPDKCPEICDELSKKYEIVKTIHKSNGGVSSARNLGIENACGKYITFCDSDDYVTLDFHKIFEYIKNNPLIEVFSVGLIKNGTVISKFKNQLFNPQQYNDLFEIIKKDVSICCCSKIVKRDFIQKHNLYIPSGIKSEDFAWSINLLLKSSSYMLLDIAYYIYVDRESSVTHSVTLKGIQSQITNYRCVNDMILATKLNKSQQKSLLKLLMQGYIYSIYTSKLLNKEDRKKAKILFKQNKDLLYKPNTLKLFLYYLYLKVLYI